MGSTLPLDWQRDRRLNRRLPAPALEARIRRQGTLFRLPVRVIDFNRHGIAVCSRRALLKDQIVLVSLSMDELSLTGVVGIVHNCLALDSGFRCGVRFRTGSPQQADGEVVEATLAAMEARLTQAGAGNDEPFLP